MRGMAVAGVALALGLLGSGAARADFTVTSPDISEGGTFKNEQVANVFGCKGDNMTPGLSWSGAPAGTKSYAVTVYDPDAPTGSGFWHWVVFNIPVGVTSLPKGPGGPKTKVPKGAVQVRTDYSMTGWGGPCPPPGDKPHHYAVTVYAVDSDKLGPDKNASPAVVGFYLHFHSLAKATINATYGR